MGSRWRLGDGCSVSVWKDLWLRGRKDNFVRLPMVAGTEDMRVCDLQDTARGGWNENLVDSLFTNQETCLIKRIPLYNAHGKDKLLWWRSRNEVYSVRSAYYDVMEDLIDNQHLRKEGNWMFIWRLKIPHKVKLLLWRVARGCLRTRMNLRRMHVPCEDQCPMCDDGVEDDMHLFF